MCGGNISSDADIWTWKGGREMGVVLPILLLCANLDFDLCWKGGWEVGEGRWEKGG